MSIRLVTWILVPTAVAGAVSLHYGVNSKYVDLNNNEMLYNQKLYSLGSKIQQVGHDLPGYSKPMTGDAPLIWTTNTDSYDKFKIISRIAQYTVKLQTACSSGTGWFLDYEIPKNGKTYPTKWWIATNAHVINTYKFRDNPYGQVLPLSNWQRGCSENGKPTDVYLMKDNSFVNKYVDRSIYSWVSPKLESVISTLAWNAKYNPEDVRKQDFVYTKLRDPKLFYVPTNFLGERHVSSHGLRNGQINYMKDFAVMEVDFENEHEARNITNNFYEWSQHKDQRLNLFSKELMARYSGDELLKNDEDYFFAGYPGSKDGRFFKHSLTTNFSYYRHTVGKLINIRNSDPNGIFTINGRALPGHYRGSQNVLWGGKEHYYWGYQYAIANINEVAPGASGSLITDSKGEVLGILTSASTGRIGYDVTAFVTPLSSEGLVIDSKIVLPKYDLIKGSDWQIGSYKEQLEKYHPNMETHLTQRWQESNAVK